MGIVLKTDYNFTGNSQNSIYTWSYNQYEFNTSTLSVDILNGVVEGSFEGEYTNYSRDVLEAFYSSGGLIYYHNGQGGFTVVEDVNTSTPSFNIHHNGMWYNPCQHEIRVYKAGVWYGINSGDRFYYDGQWIEIVCPVNNVNNDL